MNIDEILNMIDDMLEEAWSLPFSGGRCVVDAQKVKECIEDIRLNLPGEIKQAKMIVADRNDIIKSAERQAESALRKAEERARMLIAQEEIVKQRTLSHRRRWLLRKSAALPTNSPIPSSRKQRKI